MVYLQTASKTVETCTVIKLNYCPHQPMAEERVINRYEPTRISVLYCKPTLRPLFGLYISLHGAQFQCFLHARVRSPLYGILETEWWTCLHYQCAVECSIHQGNKKLNSLFLPAVTHLPRTVKISTCAYIPWSLQLHQDVH